MPDNKAIETQERSMGENYRKSTDGVERTGAIEMNEDHVQITGDRVVDEEIVAQGLQALEGKKKHWYTYMTTKDFWFVLALG